MTTTAILQKATTPAFILGGFTLMLLGVFITMSTSMVVGKESESGVGTKIPKAGRVALGILIIICGLLVSNEGIKSAQGTD